MRQDFFSGWYLRMEIGEYTILCHECAVHRYMTILKIQCRASSKFVRHIVSSWVVLSICHMAAICEYHSTLEIRSSRD